MIDRRSLVLRNIRRNKKNFAFTASGIVLGISSFVFFVALGGGVREHVLGEVFVSNQLEVVPRTIEVGGFRAEGSLFQRGTGLDAVTVEEIAALDGVVGVYPKQEVAFPAYASGGETLVGRTFWTELVCDGLPARLAESDGASGVDAFRDWYALVECGADSECAPGSTCNGGTCTPVACAPQDEVWAGAVRDEVDALRARVRRIAAHRQARLTVRDLGGMVPAATRYRLVVERGERAAIREALAGMDGIAGEVVAPDPDAVCTAAPSYCQPQRRRCEMPVPALLSYTLLELYNGSIHSALSGTAGAMRGLPQMTEDLLIGFQFDALIGRGYLGDSRAVAEGDAIPLELQMRIVGFSDLAIPVGATVPLEYVTRWNRAYNGDRAADQYNSILVRTERTEDLHRVAHSVVNELGLDLDPRYEAAQRASLMVTIITAVMALLSLLIVGLAAINIMHTFLMVVAERKREIGILRAVGASRRDVYALILGEAFAVGLVGVGAAIAVALLAIHGTDLVFTRSTPDFPFKPQTLFHAPWTLWAGAAAIGLASCLLGAWAPASRAAAVDPARTMGGY